MLTALIVDVMSSQLACRLLALHALVPEQHKASILCHTMVFYKTACKCQYVDVAMTRNYASDNDNTHIPGRYSIQMPQSAVPLYVLKLSRSVIVQKVYVRPSLMFYNNGIVLQASSQPQQTETSRWLLAGICSRQACSAPASCGCSTPTADNTMQACLATLAGLPQEGFCTAAKAI